MVLYIPKYAEISWQDGQPESGAYGDIYFSRAGGLEETRHVFIKGGRIAEKARQNVLTVCETGFGTGLNFLACWQEWRKNALPGARLDYWSVEKYPLRRADLARALAEFPELAEEAGQLLKSYPLPLPGWHRLILDGGRISLTIMLCDISEAMSELRAKIDVWFLDGFAPAKNPDMWCAELFTAMQRQTSKGGIATTFTAAGHVKRGLEAAGFSVEKIPGFGRKREMITASFNGGVEGKNNLPESCAVIGAGLAGCAAANALARRGVKVKIIDNMPSPGMAASGNPAAVIKPHYTADWSPAGRFSAIAFQYAPSLLAQTSFVGQMSGVLALDSTHEFVDRHNRLFSRLGLADDVLQKITADASSDIAGIKLKFDALWHPHAGWYRMSDMCQRLLENDNIEFVPSQLWQRSDISEPTILANSFSAKQTMPWLPLEAVRGQMSIVKANDASQNLKTSIHYGGYFTNALDGLHGLGSTFKRHDTSSEIREADTAEVIQKLAVNIPTLEGLQVKSNFAATRSASRDRLPITGQAINENGEPIKDLYLSIGHGSKGAATCLFAGEIIAAQICGEAIPLNENIYNHTMSPKRFK